MTYQDIKDRIKQIEEIGAADPEAAHSLQDKLLFDVLEIISDRGYDEIFGPSASNLAYTVLGVRDIEFTRWMS